MALKKLLQAIGVSTPDQLLAALKGEFSQFVLYFHLEGGSWEQQDFDMLRIHFAVL